MARPLRIEHRSQGFGGPNASSYTIAAQWWTNKDLNLEPFGYEPNALTVVLLVHVVPPVGNAPTPSGFSDPRSDFISYRGIWLAEQDSNLRSQRPWIYSPLPLPLGYRPLFCFTIFPFIPICSLAFSSTHIRYMSRRVLA